MVLKSPKSLGLHHFIRQCVETITTLLWKSSFTEPSEPPISHHSPTPSCLWHSHHGGKKTIYPFYPPRNFIYFWQVTPSDFSALILFYLFLPTWNIEPFFQLCFFDEKSDNSEWDTPKLKLLKLVSICYTNSSIFPLLFPWFPTCSYYHHSSSSFPFH